MHFTYHGGLLTGLIVVLGSLPIRAFADDTASTVTPLSNAHAHNDYEHPRPLLDALDEGFTSIEADVYLVEGELLVAHHWLQIQKDRSLRSLYLEPLRKRARQYEGRVFKDGPSITLLVDIKRDGVNAYAALHSLLAEYRDIISHTTDDHYEEKAVTVIISGDRAIEEITKSNPRYAGIDGRLGDLNRVIDSKVMPLISDNWSAHFQYRGVGNFSEEERKKLARIVSDAHRNGHRIRFWATPDYEKLWTELHAAGVDLIGTDDLKRLSSFLRRQ